MRPRVREFRFLDGVACKREILQATLRLYLEQRLRELREKLWTTTKDNEVKRKKRQRQTAALDRKLQKEAELLEISMRHCLDPPDPNQ